MSIKYDTGLTGTEDRQMVTFISSPDAATLPKSADVVIIGGGPAGASALWALHRADPTLKLILIESAPQLASGSSTASLENFRTCWPTACIAEQMRFSVRVFQNADEYLGEGAAEAIHVKQRGYLFCGFTPTQEATLKADVALLHAAGMSHIEYLDAAALRSRYPWLGEKVTGAKYDPVAGWLDSYALVNRYVQSASSALVLLGVQQAVPMIEDGSVTGVRTPAGVIATRRVLLANGAHAPVTARAGGFSVPVVVRPRQSFTTDFRHEAFPEDGPMIIGAAPYPHVRPEARSSAIFAWEYTWHAKHAPNGEPAGSDALRVPCEPLSNLRDPRFVSITLMLLARQFGHAPGTGFADPRYLRGVRHNIGYYVYRDHTAACQVLPDGTTQAYTSERAILDEHPQIAGLYLSLAHSGHGIMTSPAGGSIMAAHILGQPLPHPLFEQFRVGATWVEHDANAL